ncbi:MAG TPA: M48 family metallopeptidase [Thermomicrobiales bacterium]|nr:M48 family metallopeptidase [Thermomicrobiales bacterium]
MASTSPSLGNPAEMPLYILGVVVNVVIVAAIVTNYWWLEDLPGAISDGVTSDAIQYAMYALLLLIPAIVIGRQVQRASVLGQAVQLSPDQFPDIYAVKDDYARRLGLRRDPEIYLVNGNGTLNAFASSSVGRDYVVISNELFANLYDNNREGLAFIIGHELGHIKRNHTKIWYQLSILFFSMLPVISYCLSRAREYTSDRHGAWLSPNGVDGLVLLSCGRYAYHYANVSEVLHQEQQVRGVWVELVTIFRSHPLTIRRIRKLIDLGLMSPDRPSPVPAASPVTSAANTVPVRRYPVHGE